MSAVTKLFELILWGSNGSSAPKEEDVQFKERTSSQVSIGKEQVETNTKSASPITPLSRTLSWSTGSIVKSVISGPRDETPAWRPSLLQLRPLAGCAALSVSATCVFASLAILIVSDGQPIDSWPISPTVYLAIVAAIANSAIRFSRAEAIPISWWYHAYRGGTVRSLEVCTLFARRALRIGSK